MRKNIFLLVFCFLVLASIASAQGGNVILTLRNVNTNEIIDGVVVYLDLEEDRLIKYVEAGQALEMALDDGIYDLVLKIDDPATPGKDYFKKQAITVSNGLVADIYLFPVSSIRGVVKDVFDNVVGNADLKFECTDDIETEFPYRTNEFGSFTVDYMPSSSCKISANFGEAVGFIETNVPHGNITDVEVLLDKTILSLPDYRIQGAVALLFIIVIVLLIIKYRKRIIKEIKPEMHKEVKHEEKKEHPSHPAPKHSRAEDIKSTLNKKEKDVVEFLSGKGEVSQASIRHNLGVPRTSLSRILASLEQKKIIHVKKIGKAVKINFTDWFLGKE